MDNTSSTFGGTSVVTKFGTAGVSKTITEIDKVGKKLVIVTKKMGAHNKILHKSIREIKDNRKQFQMWQMSLMMGGIALQKLSGGIMKAAMESFMKISEGSTYAGRAVTSLSANFEYLKFSVGNAIATALEPFIPMIISLITSIGEFIQQHPQLVAALLIGVFAFGTLLAIIGSVALFMQGLTMSGIPALIGKMTGGAGLTWATAAVAGEFIALAVIAWVMWADMAKTVDHFGKAMAQSAKGNATATAREWAFGIVDMEAGFLRLGVVLPTILTFIGYGCLNFWTSVINEWIGMIEAGINTVRGIKGMSGITLGRLGGTKDPTMEAAKMWSSGNASVDKWAAEQNKNVWAQYPMSQAEMDSISAGSKAETHNIGGDVSIGTINIALPGATGGVQSPSAYGQAIADEMVKQIGNYSNTSSNYGMG